MAGSFGGGGLENFVKLAKDFGAGLKDADKTLATMLGRITKGGQQFHSFSQGFIGGTGNLFGNALSSVGQSAARVGKQAMQSAGQFASSAATGFSSPFKSAAMLGVGPSDVAETVMSIGSSISLFQPNISQTLQRASGYYAATLANGNAMTRNQLQASTFNAMKGGLTSVGSDAAVASYFTGKGMVGGSKNYLSSVTAVGNAAKYLGIQNEAAAGSIENLTSGRGAASLLAKTGIYTADLATGEEKTQGQIFQEIYDKLTAGQDKMSLAQTQTAIRRGVLGASINNMFEGDEVQQQMFKQYMIEKAKGRTMDLSGDMSGMLAESTAAGNRNPLQGQMAMNAQDTMAQDAAESNYIKGIDAAAVALKSLTAVSGLLAQTMGSANAMLQTTMGHNTVQGIMGGVGAVVDMASKGIKSAEMTVNPAGMAAIATMTGIGVAAGTATLAAGMAGTFAINTISGGQTEGGANEELKGGGSEALPGSSSKSIGGILVHGTGGGSADSLSRTRINPPVNGKITADYGATSNTMWRSNGGKHKGVDYGVTNVPVKAIGDGTVVATREGQRNSQGSGSYGNYVKIRHANGYSSLYAHLSSVLVTEKQKVKKGDIIGISGNTGDSSGPHLHLEVDQNGTWVNPHELTNSDLGSADNTNTVLDSDSSSGTEGQATSTTTMTPEQSTALSSLIGKDALTGNAQVNESISAIKDLYSGDQNKISSAISSLTKLFGVSPSALSKSTSQPDYLSAPGVNADGTVQSSSAANAKVNINLTIGQASDSEARRFATLVKEYLDADTLTSNLGSR